MNKVLLVIWILLVFKLTDFLDENYWDYRNWYKLPALIILLAVPYLYVKYLLPRQKS